MESVALRLYISMNSLLPDGALNITSVIVRLVSAAGKTAAQSETKNNAVNIRFRISMISRLRESVIRLFYTSLII
jgi:hypothetical protein